MGPISCIETSVRNCHFSLRNIPEEGRFQVLRGGSLKSREVYVGNYVGLTPLHFYKINLLKPSAFFTLQQV